MVDISVHDKETNEIYTVSVKTEFQHQGTAVFFSILIPILVYFAFLYLKQQGFVHDFTKNQIIAFFIFCPVIVYGFVWGIYKDDIDAFDCNRKLDEAERQHRIARGLPVKDKPKDVFEAFARVVDALPPVVLVTPQAIVTYKRPVIRSREWVEARIRELIEHHSDEDVIKYAGIQFIDIIEIKRRGSQNEDVRIGTI
jgi:hypothetical protein